MLQQYPPWRKVVIGLLVIVCLFIPIKYMLESEDSSNSTTFKRDGSGDGGITSTHSSMDNAEVRKDMLESRNGDGDVSADKESGNTEVIAWLSQGNAKNYRSLAARFQAIGKAKVRFIYHAFDEPCPSIPDDGLSQCIFQKGTSFSEGRHIVLRRALETKANFKYFVVFDDDVELWCGERLKKEAAARAKPKYPVPDSFPPDTHKHCWESFTDKLLDVKENYPFVKPLHTDVDSEDVFSVTYQSCADEMFKAHHRDYLWFFYPSSYYKEKQSWYFNGQSKSYVAQRCFRHAWKVDGNWGTGNDVHRAYPRTSPQDKQLANFLDFTYSQLGPWNLTKFTCCHWCEIADQQTLDIRKIDPLCEKTLRTRFRQWLNGTFEIDQ